MDLKTKIIGLTILVVGVLAAVGGYYVYSSDMQKIKQQEEIAKQFLPKPTLYPTIAITPILAASPSGTPTDLAIVVFKPEGAITLIGQQEIWEKILHPFLDYYANDKTRKVTQIVVSINDSANMKEYPFKLNANFNDGVTLGFLIQKNAESLMWWAPECLGGCTFTKDYAAKYPEVVKASK